MLLQKKSIFNLIALHIENELSTVKECQSRIFFDTCSNFDKLDLHELPFLKVFLLYYEPTI